MKLSTLSFLIFALSITGCFHRKQTTYRKYLTNEGFPGIELKVDQMLAKELTFGEETELRFILTNNRPHPVHVEYARLRLVSANLGNGKSSVGRTKEIETVLASGESLDFSQYLYIGPDHDTTKPNEGIQQWLGEASQDGHGTIPMTSPRENGDILIGVVLGLKIDDKPNYDIFISKHYFDESSNLITPYYTFGLTEAKPIGRDNPSDVP